ncbi:hypothetical protein EG329_009153 [Mollisiaceae sp. DMI_Dod_QoI]|nr:hypothetical protein EG329_009153 [Helotiales sp. DMI_Dod_QoI]
MHYIRFLKVPRLIRTGKDQRTLVAKVTITTDLGESFLASNVAIEALLEDPAGVPVPTTRPTRYTWDGKNGMRSLEVSIALPKRCTGLVKMSVRPVDRKYAVDTFQDALGTSGHGGIAAVRSIEIAVESNNAAAPLAERRFITGSGAISIWEETGESIARHIWDAGLVLSAYISQLSQHLKTPSTIPTSLPRLPELEALLAKPDLNILELGAGCGIVGLTFAHSLPNISKITLTDLPEAEEILSRNINFNLPPSSSSSKPTLSHQVLNWSSPLPSNISSSTWDLILVADCTYNPDVVPDLVETLTRVRGGWVGAGRGGLVLLAMKVRHESELVFFELMGRSGWVVRERCVVRLLVLGWEEEGDGDGDGDGEEGGQEIEVFVFGSGSGFEDGGEVR